MNEITRRNVLTGAAAVSAASALASAGGNDEAQAAAALGGKQNPGWYRYKVGEFEITVVTDGVLVGPLTDRYVQNVPKNQVSAMLAAMHLASDKTSNWYNPLVVNTGSKLVAIDTGGGVPSVPAEQGNIRSVP